MWKTFKEVWGFLFMLMLTMATIIGVVLTSTLFVVWLCGKFLPLGIVVGLLLLITLLAAWIAFTEGEESP